MIIGSKQFQPSITFTGKALSLLKKFITLNRTIIIVLNVSDKSLAHKVLGLGRSILDSQISD